MPCRTVPAEGRDANEARAHVVFSSIISSTTCSSAAPPTTDAGRMGNVFDPVQSSQDDETNNVPDRDYSNTELHNTCTTEHAQGPALSQAAPLDQPEFTPLTSTRFKWAAVAGEDCCRDIDEVYERQTQWRKNTFSPPSGHWH